MKSFTTAPSARGILVLAGGAAAALMLAAGAASAATGGQGAPRPAEPTAKPVAKGHEHSAVLHRHRAAHGAAGHFGSHVQHIGHRHLSHHPTHHLGTVRLPLRPLHHHHAHWRRLHHGRPVAAPNQVPGGAVAGH